MGSENVGVGGSELGEMGEHSGDEGERGVEVYGLVLGPVNGEEVGVSVGAVVEAGAELGEKGIEGRGHGINGGER